MRVVPSRRSAHADATSFEAHSSPQWSASVSMYGISSASCAAHSRSSQASRVVGSAGALAMTGTSSAIAWLTAVPIAPEELSTFSSAGDKRSRSLTAPSAARPGSCRATLRISLTACLRRCMAGCDFHPNACRRKRAWNSHSCGAALAIA